MKKRTRTRKERKSRYGNPVVTPAETAVDDNTTSYGGKRYRTAYVGDKFTHPTGTKPTAVILDIDGTLQDWGSSTVSAGMEFAKRHHEAGDVLIVATARDHEYMYESSFNWLMHNLPYPFIGPFMRSKDDPRTAGEFKRELAESLEAIYEIVGAVDDNNYVCDMWDEFALTRPGFEAERCGYTPYATWRKDLPSKSYSTSYGDYGGSYASHLGQTWVTGHWDVDAKEWVTGHWEKDAEQLSFSGSGKCRDCGQRYGHSMTCPQVATIDLSTDKAWGTYLDQREAAGAYMMGIAPIEPDDGEVADDDEYRRDLEDIVAHSCPEMTPETLVDMSLQDLQELAGPFGEVEVPVTRAQRIRNRLDLEEDIYAEYGSLTRAQIEALDMVWLDKLWNYSLDPELTDQDLEEYADTALLSLQEDTDILDVEVIEDLLDELGEEGHGRADEITEEAS